MAFARTTVSLMVGSLLAGSVFAVAQAQSNSPFARKQKKAWETNPPVAQTSQQLPNQVPAQPPYNQPAYGQPYQGQPYSGSVPSQPSPAPTGGQYYPGKKPTYPANAPQPGYSGPSTQPAPSAQRPASGLAGAPYQYPANTNANPSGGVPYQPPYQRKYQPPYQSGAATETPSLRGASIPKRPSWANRLGFGNVETSLSGHAKVGLAAVDGASRDLNVEAIVDLDARGEVSAITNGGLEYGAGLRVRAQRDRHRHGFGGRVGDCPATDLACSGVVINGTSRAVKGHTGQFYTAGNPDTKETALGLEGAYLFLRSSYGDFLVGRDDGSAYLFSLGAPSLVAVAASNSRVDYTGLDSVKTYNDASGFSEKIAYTSPRLLGDQIGIGVQFGASYAPNARACGVDYCVKKNTANALDPFAPQIEDVVEVGVSLDRKFDNGLAVELTGTYARGSEKTGNALFDDLSSYSFGLEMKYEDLVFGTSYLSSNNGFAGQGDYTAYDVGLTWKPSKWGISTSYGYADDDIAKLTAHQGVLALSYDVNDNFRLGTGVQYVNRKVPLITPTGRDKRTEDAVALFIEAGITF